MTHFAAKTFGMPRSVHSFDNSSDDEFSTFGTTRGIQNVEAMLAIFSVFKFVEQSIGEWTEALGTTEMKKRIELKKFYLNWTFGKVC